ncbi:hypothetical protein RHMOL_Rhmol10G0053400 [Rhododendron molle]|uniref:Uncharacterized protein n=1 Tax=Rhododendron molle TaxID=49168 RepID=A0ACC0M0V7_RHOML|nr:hypothetical protein RHMOL_Rhmol10G0053400 [Rhododendron molle]
MEQTRGEEIGIKIYNAIPPNEELPTASRPLRPQRSARNAAPWWRRGSRGPSPRPHSSPTSSPPAPSSPSRPSSPPSTAAAAGAPTSPPS